MRTRIVASLVLAPPALAAVYLGQIYFVILVLGGAAIMSWEWARLCRQGETGLSSLIMVAAVVAPLLLAVLEGWPVAWGVLLGTSALAALAASQDRAEAGLVFVGSLYIGAASITFLWLRSGEEGRFWALWLFAVVWAADSGAYIFGKAIGGPKLAPSISPKKTWAGFFGAIAAASIVSLAAAYLAEDWALPFMIIAAAVIAAVEQVGDLVISKLKRHFGVKDASRLIPGHGGLLDRADGLLLASLAAAAFLSLFGSGDFHG